MIVAYEVKRDHHGLPLLEASTNHEPPFVARMLIYTPAWIPARVRDDVVAHIVVVCAAALEEDLAYQVRERAREQAE